MSEGVLRKESLNNFHLWLPGSYKHTKSRGLDPECDRLIETIDRVLKDEFPEIDPQKIIKTIHDKLDGVPNEEERQDSENKMRMLFDRLVELGFEEKLLKG